MNLSIYRYAYGLRGGKAPKYLIKHLKFGTYISDFYHPVVVNDIRSLPAALTFTVKYRYIAGTSDLRLFSDKGDDKSKATQRAQASHHELVNTPAQSPLNIIPL